MDLRNAEGGEDAFLQGSENLGCPVALRMDLRNIEGGEDAFLQSGRTGSIMGEHESADRSSGSGSTVGDHWIGAGSGSGLLTTVSCRNR
jgi:hypothetical protein